MSIRALHFELRDPIHGLHRVRRAWRQLTALAARRRTAPGLPLPFELAQGGMRRLRLGSPARLQCSAGCLWITRDRIPVDQVLEAGQSVVLSAGASYVLYALDPAAVQWHRLER